MPLTLLAVLTSLVIGCSRPAPTATPNHSDGHYHSQGDGHDHVHDTPITKAEVKMPANFAELVSRIEQYRDPIKAAIDAKDVTPSRIERMKDMSRLCSL